MTDEILNRTRNLAFSAPRITSSVLRELLTPVVRESALLKRELRAERTGKVSLRALRERGCRIEKVEISDDNIADFGHAARKYGVDFALRQVTESSGRQYQIAFFQAEDAGTLDRAFREYTGDPIRDPAEKEQPERQRPTLDEQVREVRPVRKTPARKEKTRERARSVDRNMPHL